MCTQFPLVTVIITICLTLKEHFNFLDFIKWILCACLNIRTLDIGKLDERKDLFEYFFRLKKLHASITPASYLKEVILIFGNFRIMATLFTFSQIFRNCRQLEKLKVSIEGGRLKDFAELEFADLEPSENTTDVQLDWASGPSVDEVLPFFKRWQHLRRLTLSSDFFDKRAMPPEKLCDFIMGMKNLTYLNVGPTKFKYDCNRPEILREKVNQLVLPRRPNFKFRTAFYLMK